MIDSEQKNTKGKITVSVGILGILVTLALAVASFTVANTSKIQENEDRSISNSEKIIRHEDTVEKDLERIGEELDKKASDEKVDLIYETVKRIEKKLDSE